MENEFLKCLEENGFKQITSTKFEKNGIALLRDGMEVVDDVILFESNDMVKYARKSKIEDDDGEGYTIMFINLFRGKLHSYEELDKIIKIMQR